MKRHASLARLASLLLAALIFISGVAETQDNPKPRGRIQFDFSNAPEPTIEVNLGGQLLALLSGFAKKHEPSISELTEMISGIHVRGYKNGLENFGQMVRHYDSILTKEKWELIVKVSEDDEIIKVYILPGEGVVYGFFIMVAGTEETYLVNLFGQIDSEKTGAVIDSLGGMNLDLPHLKKLKHNRELKRKLRDR